MTFEPSTYSDKSFLSELTESAAASTASVRTDNQDGVLILDSAITLVNAEGIGTTFTYSYVADTLGGCTECLNDHESPDDLRDEILAVLASMQSWAYATLGAIDEIEEALNSEA